MTTTELAAAKGYTDIRSIIHLLEVAEACREDNRPGMATFREKRLRDAHRRLTTLLIEVYKDLH